MVAPSRVNLPTAGPCALAASSDLAFACVEDRLAQELRRYSCQKVAERGKGGLAAFRSMSAVPFVQVLAADEAQPAAIRVDRAGLIGTSSKCILTHERLQIDLGVFRHQESELRERLLIDGVELGQAPVEKLVKRRQAAYAAQFRACREVTGEEQSLRGAADGKVTHELTHLQVRAQLELRQVKVKLVAVADLLVQDEADVDAQGIACVAHGANGEPAELPRESAWPRGGAAWAVRLDLAIDNEAGQVLQGIAFGVRLEALQDLNGALHVTRGLLHGELHRVRAADRLHQSAHLLLIRPAALRQGQDIRIMWAPFRRSRLPAA